MINKALNLANQGFKVFPLTPGSKLPAIKEWQKVATADEAQIRAWWEWLPNANVGVAPWPDAIVFDLDVKDGNGLQESLNKLVEMGLPKTYGILTPSKGCHLYFKWKSDKTPKTTVGSAWGFPGIDIRAEGGYVVGPGSHTVKSKQSCEGDYSVIYDMPMVELPQAILDVLPYKNNYLKTLHKSATDAVPQPVSQTLPEVIRVGERDSVLYSYIGRLISQGATKDEIIRKTYEAWKRCEQPQGNEYQWSTVVGNVERALGQYREEIHTTCVSGYSSPNEISNLNDALERYCLIESGSYVADLKKDRRAEPLKWGDFQLANSNILVTVLDDAVMPLPKAWIQHRNRKRVHAITYYPKDQAILVIDGITYFNRYVPPPLNLLAEYDPQKLVIVREHLHYLLGNNDEYLNTMELWLAYTVKRPEIKIPWAPLIITTEQGTGKGWFKDLLKILVGQSNFGLATPEMLSANQIQFNDWIGGTVLVLDELKGIDAKLLNHIVTETYGTVNPKYRPKETREFFCNVIGFSNDLHALRISLKDRRWWVHDNIVTPKSAEYYIKLYNWLDTDGVQHYYTYLWSKDVSSNAFMARPPMTQAKLRMIDDTTDDSLRCVNDAYELGVGPFAYDIISTDLVMEYVRGEMSADVKISESSVGRYINTHMRKCLLPKSGQKYTIMIGSKTHRKRLICIRNPDKWVTAADCDVIEHYKQHWKGV